jgi:hypothetical protein
MPEPEGGMLGELREAWANGGSATLYLSQSIKGKRRMEGRIEHVAPTGAFITIRDVEIPADWIEDYSTWGYKK